jgi:hypothetical protein
MVLFNVFCSNEFQISARVLRGAIRRRRSLGKKVEDAAALHRPRQGIIILLAGVILARLEALGFKTNGNEEQNRAAPARANR